MIDMSFVDFPCSKVGCRKHYNDLNEANKNEVTFFCLQILHVVVLVFVKGVRTRVLFDKGHEQYIYIIVCAM